MRPRLNSKEQARLVATPDEAAGVRMHLTDTPLKFAKNVQALVDVIGADHVASGRVPNLLNQAPVAADLGVSRSGGGPPGGAPPGGGGRGGQNLRAGERTNPAWADQTAGFYFVVADAMLKTGFSADEIGKIGGGNFCESSGEAVRK